MAGKYSQLKGTLDRFEQPPDFQQKVNEYKVHYADQTAPEMARAFASARRSKQELEAQVKLMNIELEALSQLLVDNLEGLQLQKIQLESGETCFLQSEPYCSVTDKDAVMTWIKKHKMASMLSIHWSTLNAFIKERLVNGQAAIPGVAVFLKTSARLRGGNSNEEA